MDHGPCSEGPLIPLFLRSVARWSDSEKRRRRRRAATGSDCECDGASGESWVGDERSAPSSFHSSQRIWTFSWPREETRMVTSLMSTAENLPFRKALRQNLAVIQCAPHPSGGFHCRCPRCGQTALCNAPATFLQRHRCAAIGAGDAVAGVTKALGIKPCAPCEQRRQKLNGFLPALFGRKR